MNTTQTATSADVRPINMGVPTNARTITPAEIDAMVAASRAAMRRSEAAGH